MFSNITLASILIPLPGILIGLILHEYAHARVALALGDDTARSRITFNPLKHFDIVGFVFLVFLHFGWAKPVIFDPRNLRKPYRDELLISFAGPVVNLLLGIVFSALVGVMSAVVSNWSELQRVTLQVLWYAAFINFGLFVFNMLPIPPLDGSHLYMSIIGRKNPTLLRNISMFGMLGLMAVFMALYFFDLPNPLSGLIFNIMTAFLHLFGV